MKVLKFGGTSVGSAQRIKNVVKLIDTKEPKIVVLSAMTGTTNSLVKIGQMCFDKKLTEASEFIENFEKQYYKVGEELYSTPESTAKGKELIKSHFDLIKNFVNDSFSCREEKILLAQGELISTALMQIYMEEQKINSTLLPALKFMRIDKYHEPDDYFIKENLKRLIEENPGYEIYITQGYISLDAFGEIDNLKRGGSDYTASIIGAAINSEEIQIWTDIDGFHNNDPRYVEKTNCIPFLSFDEAAELAYFGAKILHPSTINPAQRMNIPVRLKNTLNPNDEGTLITNVTSGNGVKAVAAKDGITAIKIKSERMLLAYGFLRKVFEVFETFKTPIDMISTSEVTISLTIDNTQYLSEIEKELKNFCKIEIDRDQTIICVVGDFISSGKGMALKVFEALKNIPVRMISYGGSEHNISLLVASEDKKDALVALSNHLFNGH